MVDPPYGGTKVIYEDKDRLLIEKSCLRIVQEYGIVKFDRRVFQTDELELMVGQKVLCKKSWTIVKSKPPRTRYSGTHKDVLIEIFDIEIENKPKYMEKIVEKVLDFRP